MENISEDKSLGAFNPCDIEFSWSHVSKDDTKKREACYVQSTFFDEKKKAIEQIPFDFYYHFKCHNAPNCPGHKLLIVDWELGQSYRSWRDRYRQENVLLEKIKERWLKNMCAEKNDVYFYVGNMQRFVDQFMVLGVFYPPK